MDTNRQAGDTPDRKENGEEEGAGESRRGEESGIDDNAAAAVSLAFSPPSAVASASLGVRAALSLSRAAMDDVAVWDWR